jgi:hypothetical protein
LDKSPILGSVSESEKVMDFLSEQPFEVIQVAEKLTRPQNYWECPEHSLGQAQDREHYLHANVKGEDPQASGCRMAQRSTDRSRSSPRHKHLVLTKNGMRPSIESIT